MASEVHSLIKYARAPFSSPPPVGRYLTDESGLLRLSVERRGQEWGLAILENQTPRADPRIVIWARPLEACTRWRFSGRWVWVDR